MYGLDQYAGDVLLAYGLGLGVLIAVIVISLIQSERAKAALDALEK